MSTILLLIFSSVPYKLLKNKNSMYISPVPYFLLCDCNRSHAQTRPHNRRVYHRPSEPQKPTASIQSTCAPQAAAILPGPRRHHRPPRPLLVLPKTLVAAAAAAMGSPRRGRRDVASASAPASSSPETDIAPGAWGKVSAVLFDMDGVLCNSEELSRLAGVDVLAEMGVDVTVDDFVPYMGTGEANFLGGVARVKGVKDFNPESAKKRFFEIYLDKFAKPDSGIGFPGALELIMECKNAGLKVAVASSADRVKVDANLAAAGLPVSLFDAIVSADAFENLKPAPDIFLSASKNLGVDTTECIVIEDALAGVQAATAAEMRCIAVMTTLQEDALHQASPSLIRKDIGNISIRDILYGGSNAYHNSVPSTQSTSSKDHSLERLDPITRKVMTIAGTGHAGYKDGPALSAQLSEPAGLVDVGDGRLLVADTNNSTIRYIVLNGKDSEVRTVDLIGVANNI
ncbi:hypothetical protein ABZP36_020064 [Zizania latifolia]